MSSGATVTREVLGGRPLRGSTTVPGDKSISHRALLLAALAEGTSELTGLSDGDDVVRTRLAVESLGAGVTRDPSTGTVTVEGGRSRLAAPRRPGRPRQLGHGHAPAGRRGGRRPGRDPADRRRVPAVPADGPGRRAARPDGCRRRRGGGALPAAVGGHRRPPARDRLHAAHGERPGERGRAARRARRRRRHGGARAGRHPGHTEEMLAESGADVSVEPWGDGRVVRLRRSVLRPVDRHVPGDPSQAAFWVVAGVVVPGSRVTVERVHLGPERIGFVQVLVRMGASLVLHDDGDGTGSLTATHAGLTGTTVEAAEIPSLDEVPILAVAALVADSPTRFRDVGRAAGEGVRPAGGDGGPGGGLRRHRTDRRRRPGGRRRCGPDAGRGGRPRRPPHGHGGRRGRCGVRRCRRGDRDLRVGVGGHQLPGFGDTLDLLAGAS